MNAWMIDFRIHINDYPFFLYKKKVANKYDIIININN